MLPRQFELEAQSLQAEVGTDMAFVPKRPDTKFGKTAVQRRGAEREPKGKQQRSCSDRKTLASSIAGK